MTSHDPLTLEARINQQAQAIRLLKEEVERLRKIVEAKGKEAKGE